MNLVVSNNTIEYVGFQKVKTLEEACSLVEKGTKIDYLVYHKTNEKKDDKAKYLAILKDVVGKLIYIRKKEAYEVEVGMIVNGANGVYYGDEFFLSDGDVLSSLLGNLSGAVELSTMGDVSIVNDFFGRYAEGDTIGLTNTKYLDTVKSAVQGMVTEYHSKELELIELSTTATELFSNAQRVLADVEEEKLNLKRNIAKLEEVKDSIAFSASSAGSVFYFPEVRYLKERRILRIKECGTCNYLTSFLLGFKDYCLEKKFLRPRLIFVYSVGIEYESQYSDFKWITQMTAKRTDSYEGDVLFMNYPNGDSFNRLLDDKDYDFFIVVDREKFLGRHILDTGTKSPICYASCSKSALKQYKAPLECAFTNNMIEGTMFQLYGDPNYPEEPDRRKFYYLDEYKNEYEKLLNFKGVAKKGR